MRLGAYELALLFDFLADLKRPIYSEPAKEMLCHFSIDPSVDFDLVHSVQLPDFVFDLSDIHSGLLFKFQLHNIIAPCDRSSSYSS